MLIDLSFLGSKSQLLNAQQNFSAFPSQFPSTSLVLFVTDFFHPVDRFAVQRLLNGSGHSDLREAMSIENRYFTSDLSNLW